MNLHSLPIVLDRLTVNVRLGTVVLSFALPRVVMPRLTVRSAERQAEIESCV